MIRVHFAWLCYTLAGYGWWYFLALVYGYKALDVVITLWFITITSCGTLLALILKFIADGIYIIRSWKAAKRRIGG